MKIMTKMCLFLSIALAIFSCDLLTQKTDSNIHANDNTNPDDTTTPEKPNPPNVTGSTIMNYDTVIDDDVLLANIGFLQSQKMYFEHASIGGNMFGFPYYGNGTNNKDDAKGLYHLFVENPKYEITLSNNSPNRYYSNNGELGFGTAEMSSNESDSIKEEYLSYFTTGHLKDGGFLRVHRGNPDEVKDPNNYKHQKVEMFEKLDETILENADVIMMKFCYSDYFYAKNIYSDNVNPQIFAQGYFDSYETLQERAKTLNPDAKFIFWTIPLLKKDYTSKGGTNFNRIITKNRDEVNNLIRQYCKDNSQYLIDIADIESHTPDGTKLVTNDSFENGGGIEYMHDSYTSDYAHLTGKFAKKMAKVFLHTVLAMNGKIEQ